MAKNRLDQKEFGKLGAFTRYPEQLINPETGEWRQEAVKVLLAMANRLLGVSKGRKVDGLREKPPKCEVLWDSRWLDEAGDLSQFKPDQQHRRHSKYTSPYSACEESYEPY